MLVWSPQGSLNLHRVSRRPAGSKEIPVPQGLTLSLRSSEKVGVGPEHLEGVRPLLSGLFREIHTKSVCRLRPSEEFFIILFLRNKNKGLVTGAEGPG